MTRRSLYLAALPLASAGALSSAQPRVSKAFTSADRTFQFSYPEIYEPRPNRPAPDARHRSGEYPSFVEGRGFHSSESVYKVILTCVAYRGHAYPGMTFEGAAFEIMQIPNAKTEAACLPPPSSQAARQSADGTDSHTEIINGAKFVRQVYGAVATGSVEEGAFYTAFHDGKCCQLNTLVLYGDCPGDARLVKLFSPADRKHAQEELDRILHTFRFLK